MSDSIPQKLEALAEFVERMVVPRPPRPTPDSEATWREIDRQLGGQVADRRALVLGGDVTAAAHELAARDAAYVLGCVADPPSGDQGRIEFQPLTWEALDPERHGRFDLVLCADLVHRVTEPLTLLRALREMTEDGGTLLLRATMIDDPERSEYVRFVPDRYAGDPDWWFVPGRLALRWLLQTAGFTVEAEFAEHEGPRDLFPVVEGFLKAVAHKPTTEAWAISLT